jgi:hypothetical protein
VWSNSTKATITTYAGPGHSRTILLGISTSYACTRLPVPRYVSSFTVQGKVSLKSTDIDNIEWPLSATQAASQRRLCCNCEEMLRRQ